MISHDGKEYARVSDILKPFSNFSQIDPVVLERKAKIGTQVHQAICDDINCEFPVPGVYGMGYFQSYQLWKIQLGISFFESEKRYFDDKKMITGCIDALIKMPGHSSYSLVDFKTSAQESKETWPMQAHLYHYLLSQNGQVVSDRFLFIKLDKKGGLPIVFEYHFEKNIHSKCMKAIDLYWEKVKTEKK